MPARLRPLDVPELLDVSFALYRQGIGLFTAIAGAIYAPLIIAAALLAPALTHVPEWARSDPEYPVSGALPRILLALAFSLGGTFVQAATARAAADKYLGLSVTF